MIWSKGRTARRIGGALAGLGLMARYLFSAQVFKYKLNYCGPACLAMVLNSWDETRSFSQRTIAAEIFDSGSQETYNA